MPYPQFVDLPTQTLTPEGRYLAEWIEAQFKSFDKPGADADITSLNALHGPIQFYYANVHKIQSKTPYTWLRDFPSSANNAYDVMKEVEAKALKEVETQKAITENATQNGVIVEELAKLKAIVEAQVAEIAALKEAKAAAAREPEIEPAEDKKADGKKAK